MLGLFMIEEALMRWEEVVLIVAKEACELRLGAEPWMTEFIKRCLRLIEEFFLKRKESRGNHRG